MKFCWHKWVWNGREDRYHQTCSKCGKVRGCDDPWDLWERDQR